MRYLRYHLGYIIDSPNYIAKKKPKRKCKFFQINKNIEMKKRQYFQHPLPLSNSMPVDQIPMWRMAAQGQWLFQTVLQGTQSSTGSEVGKSLVYAKNRRIPEITNPRRK